MYFHRQTKFMPCDLGEGLLKRRCQVDALERDSLLPRLDGIKALQSQMVLVVH